MPPVNLLGVGYVHSRRFAAYAELNADESNRGGELSIDAEAIGGPEDGWVQERMHDVFVPARWQRTSDRFIVVWDLRLPVGDAWKLTLKLDGRVLATRFVKIQEGA
jgi:hypothetical protein